MRTAKCSQRWEHIWARPNRNSHTPQERVIERRSICYRSAFSYLLSRLISLSGFFRLKYAYAMHSVQDVVLAHASSTYYHQNTHLLKACPPQRFFLLIIIDPLLLFIFFDVFPFFLPLPLGVGLGLGGGGGRRSSSVGSGSSQSLPWYPEGQTQCMSPSWYVTFTWPVAPKWHSPLFSQFKVQSWSPISISWSPIATSQRVPTYPSGHTQYMPSSWLVPSWHSPLFSQVIVQTDSPMMTSQSFPSYPEGQSQYMSSSWYVAPKWQSPAFSQYKVQSESLSSPLADTARRYSINAIEPVIFFTMISTIGEGDYCVHQMKRCNRDWLKWDLKIDFYSAPIW